MIRFLSLTLALLLLAACGAGVKLSEVPVEDRSATALTQDGGTGAAAPVATTGSGVVAGGTSRGSTGTVTPVDVTRQGAASTGQPTPNVVFFDYDSYVVKPEFTALVEVHAKHLKADRNRKVAIEGHTDDRGGREYNLALGQRRAEALRRALGLLGVPDAQMEAVSFGKEKPAVQGSTEPAMARNRRAEIAYR